ncbi:MAG: hypothetical protein LAT68_14120 [Cyclobacteriaceae bacterium]|nr:hypothetical protein [Cyclobacteriaceae bacterium]MCH8517457.1 hypothetical protein [Cyclobacteriaceae bacterium]
MWTFIAIVILILVIKFVYDKNKQADKIRLEGGMRKKYRDLVDYFMSQDPRTKILEESSDSITMGIANIGGKTLFILTQTFGEVSIQWKLESPVFGRHKLEWDFPEYADHFKIIQKIESDIGKYQQNVMNSMM